MSKYLQVASPDRNAAPADEAGGYAFASRITGIKVPTLYALVHQRRIPHARVSARMVVFRRCELEQWLAARAVPEAAPVQAIGGAR